MKRCILLLSILALTFGCSSDDDNGSNEFDGSLESIENFFTPELVAALEDLGFNINTGNTPPDVEGEYFISPVILTASNVPSDNIGAVFADYTASFSNQNNGSLTIDFMGEGGNQSDIGNGSFVAGDGNEFTVLLKLTSQIGSIPVDTAFAISGTLTEDGIENLQNAVLMLDDKGDPEGVYIENNQGRLLSDSDGFSPRQ